MKTTGRTFSQSLALLLLFCLWTPQSHGLAANSAASLTGLEADLNPIGAAYELNLDVQGMLWISDYGAGEIWRVNPQTSETLTYHNIPAPSDARPDAAGNIWWSDFDNARLGKIPTGTQTALVYPLPGVGKAFGTFIETSGTIWVSDSEKPNLFRFSPAQDNELCSFTFPAQATLSYLVGDNQSLWVADTNSAILYRLEFNTLLFTSWTLPTGSWPQSLILGANDEVAWTDQGLNSIFRFQSGDNTLTQYRIQADYLSGYLARDNSIFWFSKQYSPEFGSLDPSRASGSTATLQPAPLTIQPTCAPAGSGTPLPAITSTQGSLTWAPSEYLPTPSATGWALYALPQNAFPSGITIIQNKAWMIDAGRKKLLKLTPPLQRVHLPLITRP